MQEIKNKAFHFKKVHREPVHRRGFPAEEPCPSEEEEQIPGLHHCSSSSATQEQDSPRPASVRSSRRPDSGNVQTRHGNAEGHLPPHRYGAWQ
mgnify:CR=1 FL=1